MQPYKPRPQGLLGTQNGGLEKLVGPDHHFEYREDPGEEVGSLMTQSPAPSPQASLSAVSQREELWDNGFFKLIS